MRLAVLTSSRADYSIYYPLLKKLKEDRFFELSIIPFGTHLSKDHGYTIKNILADGFEVKHRVEVKISGSAPEDIALYMSQTIEKFSTIWKKEKFDRVIALGDRYEMFAAVSSGVPFNVKFAHIHGGETTLGAIDDAFRHSITSMSDLHFTTAEEYKKRVVEIKGSSRGVYNTGALSFDNLAGIKLLSVQEFREKFGIDLSMPSILITFHPETVSFKKNEVYVKELVKALKALRSYQLVITMPNSDTMGTMIRSHLNDFISASDNSIGVENFGTLGYLSCMKHCRMMLGNTSSGFGEASFFPKPVVNLGDRQLGRLLTPNIINSRIEKENILKAVKKAEAMKKLSKITVYGNGRAAEKIVKILKKAHEH